MYNSIFCPSTIHPVPLNLDVLQHWIDWLIDNPIGPTWMIDTIDNTLGWERTIDMVWLSVLMPTDPDEPQPSWMYTLKEVAHIYQTGIDLLDRSTVEHMDVADVKAMWPRLSSPAIARTFLLRYKSYIDVRRQLGHPAHDLQNENWFNIWMDKLSTCDAEALPYLMDALPSLYALSEQMRHPFRLPTSLLTPSAMHVLWSSGLLDPSMDIESLTNSEPSSFSKLDAISQASASAVERLKDATQLTQTDIVLRLHGFAEAKPDSQKLRPWLWNEPRL